MFSLTVIDQVRLDSEQVAQNYTIHARATDRLARLALTVRIVTLSLLAAAMAAATGSLLTDAGPFRIAAVATSALALIAGALQSALQLERRVYGHRSLAHRLWLVAERYRSLIAEVEDGLADRAALLRRRDDLILQLHAIYDDGFGADQRGFERERLPKLSRDEAA